MELLSIIGLGLGLVGAIVLYKAVKSGGVTAGASHLASINERLAKIGISIIAIGFIVQILAVFFPLPLGSKPSFVLEKIGIVDGPIYEAKAFNWDKEKWIDVEVVFNEDEATIFVYDETRTLFLVHPDEPKNPAKIEAIDGERDVHWDIKIEFE